MSSSQSQKMEDLNRLLECSICLERMKSPRMLPCLHSFCERCLGQHMEEKNENGSFMCPLCNAKFQVPEDGVTGFKRNIFIAEVSELFVDSEDVNCDLCKIRELESMATSKCLQCRDNMCSNCAKNHCLFSRATAHHQVVNLVEVRNGGHFQEMRDLQKVYCSVHEGELLKLYCEECEKPICMMCKATEHDQHKTKTIQEAAKDTDDVIQKLVVDWRTAAEHCETLSAKRKDVLENIVFQEKQIDGDLERVYATIKDEVLQAIASKEGKSRKEEVTAAKKQAEVAFNEAEFSRVTITGTLRYVDNILDSAQDVEKLQQFKEIRTRLEQKDMIQLEKHDRQPRLKERAVRVHCVVTRLQGETGETCTCFGMSIHKSSNRIAIPDCTHMKVKVFDMATGHFLFEVMQDGHKLITPWDVTFNEKGEIFLADRGIRGVVRYDEKGRIMKVTPDMCPDESLVSCFGDQLVVTDTDGGRILFTDFDCNINKVIDKTSIGLDEFRPIKACFDNDELLVVTDFTNDRVHVIDCTKPAVIKTFTENLHHPVGVCVDQWGNILVANNNEDGEVLLIHRNDTPEYVYKSITCKYDPCSTVGVICPRALAITGPGEVAVMELNTGNVKIFNYADV